MNQTKQTIQQIYETMNQFYPFSTQMSFDNAGFLVGDGNQEVEHILIALDITSEVIEEAISKQCELIITHHPIIFTPLKSLVAQNPTEKMIIQLIKHNIAVISAHTNLDRSREGVNYHLAQRLGLKNGTFLIEEGTDSNGHPYGLGWVGDVEPTTAQDFAKFVSETLQCQCLRLEDADRIVERVAVGGGSCGSMIPDVAKQGCDTFVTGDLKYDQFLDARERGLNLIDGGHFPTEQVICEPLAQKLKKHFEEEGFSTKISLSEIHKEVCISVQ